MSDVIKTYVWHQGVCYFVSTIERDSSAAACPEIQYNETMVWSLNAKKELGNILFQDSAPTGSIKTHQKIVETLFTSGAGGLEENE